MKPKLFVQFLLLSLSLFLIVSCEKSSAGPQGPKGDPGKDGTKITSRTFVMSNWSYASPHYYINLNVPELTEKNIDSSLVMVYFKILNHDWFALPYTQYNSPINYYMGFVSSAGEVQVTWTYDSSLSTGDDPNDYYNTTVECKVVIIPSASKKAGVNHSNFSEVQLSYQLN